MRCNPHSGDRSITVCLRIPQPSGGRGIVWVVWGLASMVDFPGYAA